MSNAVEKFQNLLQEFVNKPYEELREIANNALIGAMGFFAQFDKEHNGAVMVAPIMNTMLASDGKFTTLEHKLLSDLIGDIDYESAKSAIQAQSSSEWVDAVDKLIDACDDEMKSNLLVLVTCFAAVDHSITIDEQRYIVKLMQN